MYVFQMNDGSWRISEYTSTKYDIRMRELDHAYHTRQAADCALEQWMRDYPDAIKRKW